MKIRIKLHLTMLQELTSQKKRVDNRVSFFSDVVLILTSENLISVSALKLLKLFINDCKLNKTSSISPVNSCI